MREHEYPNFDYDNDLIAAARGDGRSRVRVYRLWDTVVVLGAGSRPERELELDACRDDKIPVLKRRGGGCSVVIDPGNVIVSVVATGQPFGNQRGHFNKLTGWLIDGLAEIGLPGIKHAGICDLACGERKVGGACLYRSRDLLYYTASLLVDPEVDAVTRYLKHPPREPDYRAGRAHNAFMGSLAGLPGYFDRDDLSKAEQMAVDLRRVLRPPVLGENAENTFKTNKEAVS